LRIGFGLNERLFELALGGQANHQIFLRNLSVRTAKKPKAAKFKVWW